MRLSSTTTSYTSAARASCGMRVASNGFASAISILRLTACVSTIQFAADFADLFEVRGMVRETTRRGRMSPKSGTGRSTLSYTGLDDRRRSTTLRFDPAPGALSVNQAGVSAFAWRRGRPARSSSRSTVAAGFPRRSLCAPISLRSATPGGNCDPSRRGPLRSSAPTIHSTKPRGAPSPTSTC